MFQCSSEEPQVKLNLKSSITNLLHDLPHELRNKVMLWILGNYKVLEKSQIRLEESPF